MFVPWLHWHRTGKENFIGNTVIDGKDTTKLRDDGRVYFFKKELMKYLSWYNSIDGKTYPGANKDITMIKVWKCAKFFTMLVVLLLTTGRRRDIGVYIES